MIKNGANATNNNPDLVARDFGRVQSYCRSHSTETLGQATQKAVGWRPSPKRRLLHFCFARKAEVFAHQV
jgi:hypothetical protein